MGALGDHLAAVDEHDPVSDCDRCGTVRDYEGRLVPSGCRKGFDHLELAGGVNGRGSVVKDQHAGVGQERPGQGQSLALAAGEGHAPFAHGCLVALSQFADELVGLCKVSRLGHLLVGRIRTPDSEVGLDRVIEKEAVLEDHGYGPAHSS